MGEHLLRFTPKEQFKNELSLRSLTLPYLCFQGNLRRSKKKKLPQLTVDLFIKKLNIDLTTDVLNQLLVVQNTFIKVSGSRKMGTTSGPEYFLVVPERWVLLVVQNTFIKVSGSRRWVLLVIQNTFIKVGYWSRILWVLLVCGRGKKTEGELDWGGNWTFHWSNCLDN